MTPTAEKVRLILGLSSDVVDDATLETAVELAEEWCAVRAGAYRVTAPTTAIVLMSLYFLRHHLDLAGIKPSSLSMPDLSMSTDFSSACNMLEENAMKEIKAVAFSQGSAFKHIRSGKVQRWHR